MFPGWHVHLLIEGPPVAWEGTCYENEELTGKRRLRTAKDSGGQWAWATAWEEHFPFFAVSLDCVLSQSAVHPQDLVCSGAPGKCKNYLTDHLPGPEGKMSSKREFYHGVPPKH